MLIDNPKNMTLDQDQKNGSSLGPVYNGEENSTAELDSLFGFSAELESYLEKQELLPIAKEAHPVGQLKNTWRCLACQRWVPLDKMRYGLCDTCFSEGRNEQYPSSEDGEFNLDQFPEIAVSYRYTVQTLCQYGPCYTCDDEYDCCHHMK